MLDVMERFCWNDYRRNLFSDLQRFLQDVWLQNFQACPAYVDGSFVRNKERPDDIDLVLDITAFQDDLVDRAIGSWFRSRWLWKENYNADVYLKYPNVPKDLTAFFQYVGGKAAVELDLPEKHLKGILLIQGASWTN